MNVAGAHDALSEHPEGILLSVYAQPRASRTGISGLHDGRVKVALRAPPVDGKANAELVRYLADQLGIPKSHVVLMAGASGRRKRVLVEGVTAEVLVERLGLSVGE